MEITLIQSPCLDKLLLSVAKSLQGLDPGILTRASEEEMTNTLAHRQAGLRWSSLCNRKATALQNPGVIMAYS